MSAAGRGEEVGGNAGGNVGGSIMSAMPAVIDLTEDYDNDVGSESSMGWRGDGELGGASDVATVGSSSHTGGAGQRLPRFGRDLVDAGEQDDDFQLHSFETAPANDAGMLGGLPGANYLALPPRRSDSGRVQYSTLRRPARQPSPPRDMDDGGIEYMGTRSFANVQERRPTPGPAVTNNVPRSVTPYPANLNNTIDLTDEPDDLDDDVLFVNERRAPGGVDLEQPNANAGAQTRNGDQGGFGIGRLANILRDGGAALGGRLAQRVHDFNQNRYAGMTNEELAARRGELEEATMRAARERQERHDRVRRELEARRHNRAAAAEIRNPRRPGGHVRIPRVRVDADGNIPGFERVGWFPFNGGGGVRNNDGGGGAGPAGLGNMANMMDYGLAAFDLGMGGGRDRQPTPKYEPPAEPETGFTRNPGEDEVVVCPNCGDELGVGVESEAKGEIWVNKGCGHVSLPFPISTLLVTDVRMIGLLRRLRTAPLQIEEQEGQRPRGGFGEFAAAVQALRC